MLKAILEKMGASKGTKIELGVDELSALFDQMEANFEDKISSLSKSEPVANDGDHKHGLQEFVNAFGNENGAKYLLEGKSFEDAQNSFIKELNEQKERDSADIKAKDEEILTLKNQLSEAIGGAEPIASTPLTTKETPKTHARIQGDK